MISENVIKSFVKENTEAMYDLLRELCLIPAPSGKEELRAQFCKNWFEKIGADNVYVDDALNVVCPFNCENSNNITVFVAHTDTVFPDTAPMPYSDDGEIVRCPGVGDDTASLVVLMLAAKFFVENHLLPKDGIMFVANSCEEGLGNLKGTRKLFEDYEGRIKQFISFDAASNCIFDRCVGSHRYEVEVKTEGGHSYGAFGKKSAIAVLAGMIDEIYKIVPPAKEGYRATYNVGIINGGTSVNTIAQSASMLCEYRSDNVDFLEVMQGEFFRIFEAAKSEDAEIIVNKVGDRPCARGVDEKALSALVKSCAEVMTEVYGSEPVYHSASTDCNIPLACGIPAACFGVYIGGKAHTREEWIKKDSLIPGLEVGIKVALKLTEDN